MADYQFTASGGGVVGYDPILRDNSGDPILDSNGQYIETDTSTHLRAVVFTASGGAVAGGLAGIEFFPDLTTSYIGQGGAVVGYDSILRDHLGDPILDSNGQYIETGPSTHIRAVVLSGTRGGAVVGGAAAVTGTISTLHQDFTASGGAVVGYDPILRDDTGDPILDSNGQYIETGQATHLRVVVLSGSRGGAVAGGTAGQLKASPFVASAGAVVGGSATHTGVNLTIASLVASGGAVVGGSATFATGTVSPDSYAQIGAGGAVVGGTSLVDKGGSHIASGGAVVGGAATVAASLNYAQTATGGAVVGGAAAQVRVRVQSAQGGAVVGGAPRIRLAVVVRAASGAVVGGTARMTSSALQTVSFMPSGGAVVGGTADVSRSRTVTGKGQVFFRDTTESEFYRPATTTTFYPDDETMELAA